MQFMRTLSFCQACLSTLSDPTRSKIVELLFDKSPQTVNEIVAQFRLRQPTISHHLGILKENSFVTGDKKGNEVYYSINPNCHKNPQIRCALLNSSISH